MPMSFGFFIIFVFKIFHVQAFTISSAQQFWVHYFSVDSQYVDTYCVIDISTQALKLMRPWPPFFSFPQNNTSFHALKDIDLPSGKTSFHL